MPVAIFQPARWMSGKSDTASSGGVGIRLTALDKAIIGLETGTPLTMPTYTMADRSWNFRFSVKAAY